VQPADAGADDGGILGRARRPAVGKWIDHHELAGGQLRRVDVASGNRRRTLRDQPARNQFGFAQLAPSLRGHQLDEQRRVIVDPECRRRPADVLKGEYRRGDAERRLNGGGEIGRRRRVNRPGRQESRPGRTPIRLGQPAPSESAGPT
jgi:hypothetical protein